MNEHLMKTLKLYFKENKTTHYPANLQALNSKCTYIYKYNLVKPMKTVKVF